MKYEWRKQENEIYSAKQGPSLIEIPGQSYIMICGEGDPNKEDFSERVGVLYSLAFQIKNGYKKACSEGCVKKIDSQYEDYAVYPLEGIWTTSDPEHPLDKDRFVYRIMLKQPDVITEEMFKEAYDAVARKKPHQLLKEVEFFSQGEGVCVQMMHKGPFDDEPKSFAKMDKFVKEKGYERRNHWHREIYVAGARQADSKNKKTILRYALKDKAYPPGTPHFQGFGRNKIRYSKYTIISPDRTNPIKLIQGIPKINGFISVIQRRLAPTKREEEMIPSTR